MTRRMLNGFAAALALVALSPLAIARTQPKQADTPVELELLTWPELYRAIHEQGKTTALLFNGGTEQRGPQAVTGGHTFIARALGREIAAKLGNAIVAPILPYSVNNASAELPGTIGVSGPLFAAINEEVAEQLITNGFKSVVLMGDHGGGQQELAELARKLNGKHATQGIRVVYCGHVYQKASTDFNRWLRENGLPVGSHASLPDTSELLYLQGDQHWIRKDQLATAVTGTLLPGSGKDANARPVRNGIDGDARRSSPEIGKRVSDMKVDYAVAQIRRLLSDAPAK